VAASDVSAISRQPARRRLTLRVAITGVSGDVGRGIVYGLRRNPPHAEPIWLVGLDADAQSHSFPLLDRCVSLPLVKDPGYVEALVAILSAHKIDVLLPGIDSEIIRLSAARHRLAASGAEVVLAPRELVEAAHDKLLTAEYLSARGVPVPPTCDAGSPVDIGFPIIAKPRHGHGSQGIAILPDPEALQAFLDLPPSDYCLQHEVDGPEFTVGLLYDTDGVMRDAIAMERTLEGGRTVLAKVVDGPEILQFMEDFGRKVPGRGAVNVQLRWDRRRGPMVFEVNARLSGSTDMRVLVGFNDPLRLARHFGRQEPIVRARPNKAVVHRSGVELWTEAC
jgi:carbamoyl-phosphate synthase large subunit